MALPRRANVHAAAVGMLVLAALVVAACGSSSSSSSPAVATPTTASGTSSGHSTGAAISTAKGADGTYLTGASGRALYLWVADKNGKSACLGACAKVWPPLIASATPTASGGAKAADLGTTTRGNGTRQVTYMGHPLYYYIADAHAGAIKGQGSNSFGARWWLVAPSGKAITAASTSSSGSSGGYSGGSSSASSSGSSWG